MLSSTRLSVSLGQTEVNNVDVVLLLANSNQEVIWLNISVQEMSGVDILDPLNLNLG